MELAAVGSALGLYTKEVISIVVPFGVWLLNRHYQPSARLIHSVRHSFKFLVPEPLRDQDENVISPSQMVNVASVSVSNVGRTTAKNIEIIFNWKPSFVNVWPIRHYTTRDSEDGRHAIILENLAPKEIFGIELLSINRDLPGICNVRSEQAESVEKRMMPQIVHSRSFLAMVAWLLLIGSIATVYLALVLIEISIR